MNVISLNSNLFFAEMVNYIVPVNYGSPGLKVFQRKNSDGSVGNERVHLILAHLTLITVSLNSAAWKIYKLFKKVKSQKLKLEH